MLRVQGGIFHVGADDVVEVVFDDVFENLDDLEGLLDVVWRVECEALEE